MKPSAHRILFLLLGVLTVGSACSTSEPPPAVPTPIRARATPTSIPALPSATPTPSPAPSATPSPTPEPSSTPTPTPEPPRIVFLLRHGEKSGGKALDPPLSKAGQARALALRHTLENAGITAIYTTHFLRTQQMAKPLADRLGLSIQPILASDVQGMADAIRNQNPGGVVLAIGHSDSVVTLIGLLGGGEVPAIGQEDFDNLYVLTFDGAGVPRVACLQYGEPSP